MKHRFLKGALCTWLCTLSFTFPLIAYPSKALKQAKLEIIINHNLYLAISKIKLIAKITGVSLLPYKKVHCVQCSITPAILLSELALKQSNKLGVEYSQSSPHYERYKLNAIKINLKHLEKNIDKINVLYDLLLKNFKATHTIPKTAHPPKVDNVSITAINNRLIELNGYINQLILVKIEPSEVYQNINYCIQYIEFIFSHFNPNFSFPEPNPYKHYIKPQQVFLRLRECLVKLQMILAQLKLTTEHIQISTANLETIKPYDVYLVSQFILALSSRVYNQLDANKPLKLIEYYPGYKLPSQVYQRASILQKLLNKLYNQIHKRNGYKKN